MSLTNNKFKSEELSFFIKVIVVYAAWHFFHAYMCATPERRIVWFHSILGLSVLDARLTSGVLDLLGYHAFNTNIWIQIDHHHYLWIAEHCLAIPAMVVFSFSMLLFKGRLKDKLWFIPLGVIIIFLINLFRLVSLSILRAHLEESAFELYHRYVFLVITYGLILLMVFWWMDRTMRNKDQLV